MEIKNISILGGCGHIGLPLGILCAQEGFSTTLVDSDLERVKIVSDGELPFYEKEAALPLKAGIESGRLQVTSKWAVLAESDMIVITTPGSFPARNGGIDSSFIESVITELCSYLRPGQIVLLRSTVAPGVSEKLFQIIKKKTAEVSFGYCPERIAQGEALSELRNIPQIVSGFDQKSIQAASLVFSRVTTKPVIELSVQEAELAKFFCNVWRYINFSVSNQFWQIAEEANCRFDRIREAVTKDYPRMSQFGKAGFVGGSCLKKDVLQLGVGRGEHFLGKTAMNVNEGMLAFIEQRLRFHFGSCKDLKVGVLGLTFKKDSDDLRGSVSLDLVAHLKALGAIVRVHDPFVAADSLEEVLDSQAVIVATLHSDYRKLSFKKDILLINPWGELTSVNS